MLFKKKYTFFTKTYNSYTIKINVSVRTMFHVNQVIKRTFVFGKFANNLIQKSRPHVNSLVMLKTINKKEILNNAVVPQTISSKTLLSVENTKKLLLLSTDPNRNFISGLMSISPQEYLLLQENDINALKYQNLVKITITKVLYVLYGMDKNLSLWDKFEIIFSAQGLNIDDMPKLLPIKKYITLLQHVLTYICHGKELTYETLKDFAMPINCDSYKGQEITILTFFEAYVIKKNLISNAIDEPYIIYYIINPNNLQAVPYYSNMESLLQTKQLNSDVLIIDYRIFYIRHGDVKSYSVAGFFEKNLLSISFINEKEFFKYFNNIMTTLQELIKNTTNSILKTNLKDLANTLINIKKMSGVNYKIKIKNVHQKLLKFHMNPENANVKVSLNIILENNNNDFVVVLNKLLHRIEHHQIENIENLFPTTSQINLQERQRFLENFIREVFQDDLELLETIQTNMRAVSFINNN